MNSTSCIAAKLLRGLFQAGCWWIVTCLHFNQRTRATSFFKLRPAGDKRVREPTTFWKIQSAVSFIARLWDASSCRLLYLQALRCTQTHTGLWLLRRWLANFLTSKLCKKWEKRDKSIRPGCAQCLHHARSLFRLQHNLHNDLDAPVQTELASASESAYAVYVFAQSFQLGLQH